MINDAHNWYRLPDRGHQVLRRLHEKLSDCRDTRNDELAVILAGQAEPLDRLLHEIPPLAARFRAVISFPGYKPGQMSGMAADDPSMRSMAEEKLRTLDRRQIQQQEDERFGRYGYLAYADPALMGSDSPQTASPKHQPANPITGTGLNGDDAGDISTP